MLCDRCEQPVIEVDHYGERLTNCLECNLRTGGKSAFCVELSVEDFEALRELKASLQSGALFYCPKAKGRQPKPTPTEVQKKALNASTSAKLGTARDAWFRGCPTSHRKTRRWHRPNTMAPLRPAAPPPTMTTS